MEEKALNEKESLELISQMIRNTQQKLERKNGIPFLIWGYVTVIVSLTVWYMLTPAKAKCPEYCFTTFSISIIDLFII